MNESTVRMATKIIWIDGVQRRRGSVDRDLNIWWRRGNCGRPQHDRVLHHTENDGCRVRRGASQTVANCEQENLLERDT